MPQSCSEFASVPRSETREQFTKETSVNTHNFAETKYTGGLLISNRFKINVPMVHA